MASDDVAVGQRDAGQQQQQQHGQPQELPNHLPGLGQTRCYWAIMDSMMNFRYLDPVLQSHMQEVS